MNPGDIRAYYAAFGQREWQRLERAEGAVEFAVTTEMLGRHLPSGERVLDIGGGPGRYAEWLADRGFRVTLADLSPELLDIARSRLSARRVGDGTVAEIAEADARDLSRWADASFDAVLALGPMYHLPDPDDRQRTAAELARVVRPGGVVFVALMPWLAFVRRTVFLPDERHHLADPDFVSALRERGEFANDVPDRFTGGYGVRPENVAGLFEPYGFATRTVVSTHGFAEGIEDQLVAMRATHPDAYDAAMRLLVDTACDASVLGLAGHLLYVGERVATPRPTG